MLYPIFEKQNLVYVLAVFIAALITFAFTPATRFIAKKTGAVDVPDGNRKLHKSPTPRLGGIAIAAGFAVTALCFDVFVCGGISRTMLITVLGGLFICTVGVFDDIFDLPALLKLLFQVCLATVTVIFGGAIEFITVFGRTFVLGSLAAPLTVLWIVFLINAINLIDGLDGLACGVTFMCSATLLLMAILLGDATSAIIAATLCGASAGFLPFNSNPAAVFMGDCGATLFGYVLACVSVFGLFKGATLISAVAPVLVFAFPAVDVFGAVFQRIRKKKNPLGSDRLHFHYELVDIGFSPKMAVAIIYIASAVFCCAGIISIYYRGFAVILAACTFLFLILIKKIGAAAKRKNRESDAHDGDTVMLDVPREMASGPKTKSGRVAKSVVWGESSKTDDERRGTAQETYVYYERVKLSSAEKRKKGHKSV